MSGDPTQTMKMFKVIPWPKSIDMVWLAVFKRNPVITLVRCVNFTAFCCQYLLLQALPGNLFLHKV